MVQVVPEIEFLNFMFFQFVTFAIVTNILDFFL